MKLRYRAQAIADLGKIHSFILEKNALAAQRVIDRIYLALSRLREFPRSGRLGKVEGTRELLVTGLPYIIVYKVENDFIDVIAVFHAAQNR